MLAQPTRYRLVDADLDASLGYRTKMRPPNHAIALSKPQHYVIDFTNPCGTFDDGVENRLHIRGRAADDAQHLGRCRLMLQGFAEFVGSRSLLLQNLGELAFVFRQFLGSRVFPLQRVREFPA